MSAAITDLYERRELGKVCTLQRGFDLPTKNRTPGPFPLVTSSGPTDTHDRAKVSGPGVVTGRSGSIGNVFFIEEDFWPLNTALYVKNFHGNDERYIYYLLQSFDLARFTSGAGVPTLNRNHVHNEPVLVAKSQQEQKRIVAVLDQAFAALDRARTLAEANLAGVESLFDSALRKAIALHLDWPVKFLPEISENLDRQRVPITKHDRQPGDIPYYGASGVVDQVAGHIFDENLLLVSEDGANLLARTYPIAFSISGKSWVNNHAHALRFNDADTQEYTRLYLNSITLEPYVSGMAQPKLNQKALNQIPIPFPDEDRRAAIVAEAALIREHCNALSRSYDAQLADLANLRQSLLQKAFSGELT